MKKNAWLLLISVSIPLAGLLVMMSFGGKGAAVNRMVAGEINVAPMAAAGPDLPFSGPELAGDEAEEIFARIGRLELGATIRLPLPGGGEMPVLVNYVNRFPNSAASAVGDVADGSGIFEIAREPWGYRGFILQREERIAYVYSGRGAGDLRVARRPIGEVICEPDPNWKPLAGPAGPDPEKAAIYNGGRSVGIIYGAIPILSSLPGAEATIYLDFDGEVIEGHSWEGGRRIVAPAYNLSAAEVTEMWRRVAEDFAPFEVNVTTDLQTYLRAPQGRRIRCITTTNNFASAGGVAFNGTFLQSGEPVCWNFYSGNAGALVISHEVGHTFGLHHDGQGSSGYYGGHGSGATSWGPIMGAPYSQSVTHWSKGDYQGANEQQDDVAVIGSMTPLRHDDHSGVFELATPLSLGPGGSVAETGVIGSRDDIDSFVFQTAGGTVNLQFQGPAGSQNLDIEVKLYHANGNLITTSSPSGNLNASLNTGVASGTYMITVEGVGNGTWATNGYDDYGSLGEYAISGTIGNARWRFQVPVNALAGTVAGTVAPGSGSGFSINGGNTGSAFSIHPATGVITVANPGALTANALVTLSISYVSGGSGTNVSVPIKVAPLRGLKQEIWTGLGGSGIAPLTSSPNFPNNPNITRFSPIFQATRDLDNYGQKLSGYLLPGETGNHIFWTTADDSSEIWLSTDASPANKVRIAWNPSNTGSDVWNAFSSQQSSPIWLTAGQRYYMEVLHRDQTGPDHVSVVWQTPTRPRQLISNDHLEYPGTMPNRAPWLASRTYRIAEGSGVGTLVGMLEAGDYEPGSLVSSYTILGGNIGNAFAVNATTGAITVTGTLNFASRPKYLLDVRVSDSGGLTRTAQVAVEVVPLAVRRQVWNGISGNPVSNLTGSAHFPNNPSSTSHIEFFETPTNIADNYGQRLNGYLRAPDTGSYTFWIATDDGGELWLSTDSDPTNRQRIAFTDNATGWREWGRFASQRSAAITLEGGKFYYIEALHKEGIGGDHLSVSWSGPDFAQVILGAPHVTQQFYNHGPPVMENRTVTAFDRDDIIATVEARDWSNPGTTVTYSITGGNADGVFTINPLTGVVSSTAGRLPSGTRVLTITATDNGPTPLSSNGTLTVQVAKAGLKREVWNNLSGTQSVGDLTGSFGYPGTPDEVGYVQNFQSPSNVRDNYGQRLSGYVIPPATGNYTFWIASDDGSDLYLATDANPSNRRRIAWVNGAVGSQNWTSQGNQQSAVIALVAGQAYYIEALHKEGGGADHLAVAWQGPGFSRTVISNNHLEYPDFFRPGLKREVWNNSATIPARAPDFVGTQFTFNGPRDVGSDFVERVSGYLIPPATGNYTFWMSSDDDGDLRLSSDESAANATVIASVPGWVAPEAFDVNPLQKSMQRFLVAGRRYYVEMRHREGTGGDHATVAWQGPGFARQVIGNPYLEHPETPADRTLPRREVWNSIAGDNLSQLRAAATFPASPTSAGTLAAGAGLVVPSDAGDSFGERISGYLVAPEHGRYTFWIAGDNECELWLSTDDKPANAIRIASLVDHVPPMSWDVQPSQSSVPVALAAGQRYYVEVMHKEGIGGDHAAVAWQGPSFSRRVISNDFLEHPGSVPGKASLKREVWNGIAGNSVLSLSHHSSYQSGPPSARGVLTRFEAPAGHADHYGQRLTARLVAPESGNYKFWIASDDASELWLSPDDDPAKRMRIARVSSATGARSWDAFAVQESGAIPLVEGRRYHIEALHKESTANDHLAVAWSGPSFDRQILDGRFLDYPGEIEVPVALKREVWNGIGGNNVSNLTSNASFPGNPSLVTALDGFDAPTNIADNYGQRISGYLIAPATGSYQFWIASDDGGELWLSTDGNPATRSRIAYTNSATGPYNWTNFGSQASGIIGLTAGQRCYIEVLHKEGGGEDYVAVAWQGPGFGRRIIGGRFLEYPGLQPGEKQPANVVAAGSDPGFRFWLDYHGLTGTGRLPGADPDFDGIPNSLEFVFGGNPLGGAGEAYGLQPITRVEGDDALFIFRRSQVAIPSAPSVQMTSDLATWTPLSDGVNGVRIESETNGYGPGVDRITVRVPLGQAPTFLRLNSNRP